MSISAFLIDWFLTNQIAETGHQKIDRNRNHESAISIYSGDV